MPSWKPDTGVRSFIYCPRNFRPRNFRDDGTRKVVLIGPREGGLKIICSQTEVMVITPASPLGQELIGKLSGDSIEIATGANRKEYEIVEVR